MAPRKTKDDPLLRKLLSLQSEVGLSVSAGTGEAARLNRQLLRQELQGLLAGLRQEQQDIGSEMSRLTNMTTSVSAYLRCGASLTNGKRF